MLSACRESALTSVRRAYARVRGEVKGLWESALTEVGGVLIRGRWRSYARVPRRPHAQARSWRSQARPAPADRREEPSWPAAPPPAAPRASSVPSTPSSTRPEPVTPRKRSAPFPGLQRSRYRRLRLPRLGQRGGSRIPRHRLPHRDSRHLRHRPHLRRPLQPRRQRRPRHRRTEWRHIPATSSARSSAVSPAPEWWPTVRPATSPLRASPGSPPTARALDRRAALLSCPPHACSRTGWW